MSKQVVKRKAGRITLKRKTEIMDNLKEIIENGNIIGITNQQLANEYNINRETISGYLKNIYDKIPEEDIKHIEIKLKSLFYKILRYSQQMLSRAKTQMEQERSLRLLLQATKEFTDFLERFGMKQKVADKLEIQQEQVVLNINMDLNEYEQIKELESRRKSV